MSIQVYGQWQDYGSFCNVSRAIVLELRRRRYDVTIYGVNQLTPTYKDVNADVIMRNAAHVGIYVGYPEAAGGWLQGHAHKILVTVCETDRIPGSWVEACNATDLVVVPSTWCEEAFRNSGVKTRILVVNHGVDSAIFGPTNAKPNDRLRFLHVSGSLTFAARKGTSKLLRAYKKLYEHLGGKTPELLLKMPHTEGVLAAIKEVGLNGIVTLLPEPSMEPMEMGQLLRSVDAVVQPSRAEGFGMVPLESRCVGTPCIITNATGHTEHFSTFADYAIPTGPMKPLETQANPRGSAPTVKTSEIYRVMANFIDTAAGGKQVATKWASLNAKNWTWERVLIPLIQEIKAQDVRERMKLGGHTGLLGA